MSGRAEGMKCILESGLNGHIFGNVVPKDILECIVLNSFSQKPLF
jgi:hypothetical protein